MLINRHRIHLLPKTFWTPDIWPNVNELLSSWIRPVLWFVRTHPCPVHKFDVLLDCVLRKSEYTAIRLPVSIFAGDRKRNCISTDCSRLYVWSHRFPAVQMAERTGSLHNWRKEAISLLTEVLYGRFSTTAASETNYIVVVCVEGIQ